MKKQIGPYEIVAELGRGGMGVVYKAREESLDRFVAIKMLGNQLLENDAVAQRFMREARAVADLNHPNLVQVFRVDRHEDQPYFVMEFVEGDSLKALIRRDRQMQPRRALQILKEVATGLAAAHDKRVIHRDIKPENIMLTKYGGVKVVDFGIARVEDTDTRLTTTGIGLGTPSYLSPEVCLSQEVDQRSDIFSLGVVLFEMLTGDTPFKSDSPFELMTKVVEAKIPEIRELNPNVDEGVKQILAKMIAKRPKIRYQNCNELISDIEDYQAGRAPRYAKSMPVETIDRGSSETEKSSITGDIDPDVTAPTTPIPAGLPDASRAATGHVKTERVAATTPTRETSAGRRLALVAVLVLLLAGGGAAASWYLISNPDNPLQSVFGGDSAERSEPDAADSAHGSSRASLADLEATDDRAGPDHSSATGSLDRNDDAVVSENAFASTASVPPDPGPSPESVSAASGPSQPSDSGVIESGQSDGVDSADESADRFDATVAAEAVDSVDSVDRADGVDFAPIVRNSQSGADAPNSRVTDAARAAVGFEASGEVDPDAAPIDSSAPASTPGSRSGATSDGVATIDARTGVEGKPAATWNRSAPRVVVVAAGDPAVATTLERELEHALNASAFDVLDAALMDGMIYAEGLADVARAAFDSGADVLVYVDVIPAGERELIYYGRQDLQYLANLEVRMVNLHEQKNLGPMLEHRLEYVVLTAQDQARKVALPIADRVVGRLRSLRSQESGVASRG